ncbi:cell envelope protein SmpA [Pseudomonas izuensis]|uniref:Cell envelope protein SmpA n=1 Tax=Pseudomonas izuensis TaxID=2684212 RepID=A0ABM7RZY8_9PSED|nr:cell envelope protein SmpA [Pseudomonas izuensis]BCX70067.1 cell envelope protein SmpA [Pseudomonas izuensis]
MPSNAQYCFLIALLCPPCALATTIHRCAAPNGHITYTTLSCAIDESLTAHEVRTPTAGSVAPTLMPEAESRATSGVKIQDRDPTVVGKTEDKCGSQISARERREAILNQRIIAGMTQQDVESALGKPSKISIRNSSTSYRYETKRGRSAYIEFDERGCTKGKAKSQTAKSPL